MQEFLMTWGTAIGIFLITGAIMQAMNTTIGGKAGDKGFKGLWYTWKRVFLIALGAGLGALAPVMGMSSPFGDGVGYGVLDGVIAASVAGQAYSMIIGSLKAKARSKLARESVKPPAS
jgi:hypothetical protein